MVLVAADQQPIYYKEESESRRCARFCIKGVHALGGGGGGGNKGERPRPDAINVTRNNKNDVVLDEDEARKVRKHVDDVLRKLHRVHKSAIWNVLVGRSFVEASQKGSSSSSGDQELSLDREDFGPFEATNPRTWSQESLGLLKSLLKASDFAYDSFVVLFCVTAGEEDFYDEVAWELEKCVTYHLVSSKCQIVTNEEASMLRRGLEPVSRKTKTQGRRRPGGFCVYVAYQLLDSVTRDQMVGEAVNRAVDLTAKKKQVLAALTESRLPPQADERVRKQIKEVKEFMGRDQLHLLQRLKDVQDQESLEMLTQFMTLLTTQGGRNSSGLMGLPQLLSFLNKSSESPSSIPRSSSRLSSTKGNHSSSTLPRPTSARAPARKASIASSTASRSITPETPRRHGGGGRRESSLASIPSSGSSTPETLRYQEHKASAKSTRRGQQTANGGANAGRKPISSSSARSSINGDSTTRSPRLTPSSSLTNSPRRPSAMASRSGGGGGGSGRRQPPPDGKMITREDLRRMNRSYPSTDKQHKQASSFSRTAIPS